MGLDIKNVPGGTGIYLDGADAFLKELRQVAPDLSKELNKRLKAIGSRIIETARGKVPAESPLSRWERVPVDPAAWHAKYNKSKRVRERPGGFPAYNASQIMAGLKATTAKPKGAKWGGVLYIVNSDPAGVIFEIAGRANDPTPNTAGRKFIDRLNRESDPSRVIWAAYDEMGRKRIQQEIIDTVIDIEEEYNRRFGDEGFNEVRR